MVPRKPNSSAKVVNMKSRNVVEPLRVKTQALSSATDVATMILRIDDIIASVGTPIISLVATNDNVSENPAYCPSVEFTYHEN